MDRGHLGQKGGPIQAWAVDSVLVNVSATKRTPMPMAWSALCRAVNETIALSPLLQAGERSGFGPQDAWSARRVAVCRRRHDGRQSTRPFVVH